MVTGGEADVLRSGGLDGRDPFLCVETCRVETSGSLAIFLLLESLIQIPLSLGEHAVDSPVKKDSKTCIRKFLP